MIWSFYEMLWFFYFYSSFGWSVEVIYKAVTTGKFVNRGFFHGPVCPIYGVAVLLALVVLTPFKHNFLVLFIASTIFTSSVEFLTGLILEKIFHNKWWDYSEEPFNLKGYICLKISLIWGLSCSAAFFVLQPGVEFMVGIISKRAGIILQLFLSLLFVTDMIATLVEIEDMKRKFMVVDEIALRIHSFSDRIGSTLYGGTIFTMNKSKDIKDNLKKKRELRQADREMLTKERDELLELLKEYKQLISRRNYYLHRVFMAYPTLRRNRLNKLSREKDYIEKIIRKIRWERGEPWKERHGEVMPEEEVLFTDPVFLSQREDIENILESFYEEEFYSDYDMEQDIQPERQNNL